MDFDGLKTSILEMLSGAAIPVNTSTFQNDAINFQNRNDVLTYAELKNMEMKSDCIYSCATAP